MTSGWMKRGRDNGTAKFCFPPDLRVEWCAWNKACDPHASLLPLTVWLHPHVGRAKRRFWGKQPHSLHVLEEKWCLRK